MKKQAIVEIPLAESTKVLKAQLAQGRKIIGLVPNYRAAAGGGTKLVGYIAVVKLSSEEARLGSVH